MVLLEPPHVSPPHRRNRQPHSPLQRLPRQNEERVLRNHVNHQKVDLPLFVAILLRRPSSAIDAVGHLRRQRVRRFHLHLRSRNSLWRSTVSPASTPPAWPDTQKPLPLNPLPDASYWPCLRTLLPKGVFSFQELSLQPDGGVPSS